MLGTLEPSWKYSPCIPMPVLVRSKAVKDLMLEEPSIAQAFDNAAGQYGYVACPGCSGQRLRGLAWAVREGYSYLRAAIKGHIALRVDSTSPERPAARRPGIFQTPSLRPIST